MCICVCMCVCVFCVCLRQTERQRKMNKMTGHNNKKAFVQCRIVSVALSFPTLQMGNKPPKEEEEEVHTAIAKTMRNYHHHLQKAKSQKQKAKTTHTKTQTKKQHNQEPSKTQERLQNKNSAAAPKTRLPHSLCTLPNQTKTQSHPFHRTKTNQPTNQPHRTTLPCPRCILPYSALTCSP